MSAKQETYQERQNRIEAAMLSMKISLVEFQTRCTANYDNRWENWHDWRVRGAEEVFGNWVFDKRKPKTEANYTEKEIIELAYERFRAVQDRKGQVSWCDVYVKGVETVLAVAPKPGGNVILNTARIQVVKDSVDKLWRYSTSVQLGYSGSSSAPSLTRTIADSRESAILSGAKSILAEISRRWDFQEKTSLHRSFANKLEQFIETIESSIRQPSLFDF